MKTILNRLSCVAALSALVFSLSGCVNEVLPELPAEEETSLSGTFDFTLDATMGDMSVPEEDEDTKASVTTVVRLSWTAGDRISVVNLTTGKALGGSLTANETGTTTTFSGTLTGSVRSGDKVAFIYPSQEYAAEQDYTPVTVDFSNQTGHSNSGVPLCVYSVVTAGGNSFNRTSASFKFLMSYLQMNLTGLEANSVINSVCVNNIGSGVTLGITSDGVTATPVVGTITMTPPSTYKVKGDGTRSFYLSFAESPAVSKRTVTAYTENQLKACSWTGSKLNQSTSYTSTLASFVEAPISFKDANFKAYCVQNFDSNSDGEISLAEAKAVTSMNIGADDIETVDELKYFRNLTSLTVRGTSAVWSEDGNHMQVVNGSNWESLPIVKGTSATGKITSLDLSGNTKLTSLLIESTMLKSLDVSVCQDLDSLTVSFTQISALDLSNNTDLHALYCDFNQLTSLDVSKNVALQYLTCSNNQLTNLDVSRNTALTDLLCSENQLNSLDVSKNTALRNLYCDNNSLTSLDVSVNTALLNIYCFNNQITNLDVSKNTSLTSLSCTANQLTSLDVSKNTALQRLYCYSNQLTNLDVSKNTELTFFNCGNNQLTSLDVSRNTALRDFYCNNNQLTSLDISKNTALQNLSCTNNQLTSLDVSKNKLLRNFFCYNNQLTTLDVSENTALTMLYCQNNQLTTLDVSKNTALIMLQCSPMATMEKLIMKVGQTIRILNIPDATIIEYIGTSDMDNGGEV